MKWLNALELKFGHLAFPGLIRIIVAFNALVFILSLINPQFLSLIYLDRDLVMQGQVWRLVSYIFIPALGRWWLMPDYLWLVFWLMFLWMIGDGLEQAWGSFKLNLFYLVGMIGTTAAAFIFGMSYNNVMLNLSLLFAFATLFPNYTIYVFLILPLKIKWLAWFSAAMVALTFLGGSAAVKMSILASLGNYLLFFAPVLVQSLREKKYVAQRRTEFQSKQMPEEEALHICAVCRRTEITNPELDFRVAKNGEEYCVEHLAAARQGS
jgi:hypothetical protein